MRRGRAFHHGLVGVDRHGTMVLMEGPPQLYRVMAGPYLEERDQREGFDRRRGRPGLSRATIDCRWRPGAGARVHAGQDPAIALRARKVEAEGCERWAMAHGEVVLGYAPAGGGLRAQLTRGLRRLQARVQDAC